MAVRDFLPTAAELSKNILAVLALSSAVGGFLISPFSSPFWSFVSQQVRGGGVCVTFPDFGHTAQDTEQGEWGRVDWRRVEKHREDCGKPSLSIAVRNGGGILHSTVASFIGFDAPVGTNNFTYLFRVPDCLTIPGASGVRVELTWPDAHGGAPPAISPWVPFTILPNPEACDEESH